jgi:hypothetical protein
VLVVLVVEVVEVVEVVLVVDVVEVVLVVVVVVAKHPNAPCEVNVYNGDAGKVVWLPVITTVLVGKPLATAVHLSLVENVPGAYAIECPVEAFAQSNN